MLNYTHEIPTKIMFGKGRVQELAGVLEPFGKRVLVTYGGGSIRKIGLYDEVMKILSEGGFQVSELSGIEPNPRIESVAAGAEICKEKQIDVILAVGGGSVLDASKAIAVGAFYEGPDYWEIVRNAHDMEMGWIPMEQKKALPLVDIMTVAATGSEFDPGGVISNLKTKEKYGGRYTYPAVSILDPTYTFSVPAYHTAAGAFDIMNHIMEDYFSRTEDSDLSDGIAETVLRSVIKNVKIALAEPDNYSARANLLADAAIACSGIPSYGKQSSCWPCHAVEHVISGFYDITHGVGLEIFTPRWMRHILAKDPSCAWRFARFARNVFGLQGEDEMELAKAGIGKLEEFIHTLGLPETFTEVNIGSEHFEEMADRANENGYLANAFVALTNEDIVEIFRACL